MSDDGYDEIYAASCTVPFATDQNMLKGQSQKIANNEN